MEPTGFADATATGTLRARMPVRAVSGGAGVERYAGVAGAVLLHVALIVALLQYEPARQAIETVAPIMVSLISPVLRPPPPLEQPKPPAIMRVTAPTSSTRRAAAPSSSPARCAG
jgi:hypothetical protein